MTPEEEKTSAEEFARQWGLNGFLKAHIDSSVGELVSYPVRPRWNDEAVQLAKHELYAMIWDVENGREK